MNQFVTVAQNMYLLFLLQRKGQPYCHKPCYAAEFGPKGFGHGGITESHKY